MPQVLQSRHRPVEAQRHLVDWGGVNTDTDVTIRLQDVHRVVTTPHGSLAKASLDR